MKRDSPSSPDSVNTSTFSDIDNNVDVGVIVVITSSWNFDVLIGHPDVISVDLEILRGSHYDEFDSSFRTESLVCPFSNRANFFDGSDTWIDSEIITSAQVGLKKCRDMSVPLFAMRT